MHRDLPAQEILKIAGVDGCRAGWIVVIAEATEATVLRLVSVTVVPTFAALIDHTESCRAVGVDIPIGLSGDGRRDADTAARRMIGARRSSVFPAPPRALVQAEGDYAALNIVARSIRAGISRQTFNILPKMREADACMTTLLQQRIHESHPEVSFCTLKGDCLQFPKRRPEGKRERLALLESVFGVSFRDAVVPRGAALDDLFDAAVLAWTAARIAAGTARRLPAATQLDARGLRMEIVY